MKHVTLIGLLMAISTGANAGHFLKAASYFDDAANAIDISVLDTTQEQPFLCSNSVTSLSIHSGLLAQRDSEKFDYLSLQIISAARVEYNQFKQFCSKVLPSEAYSAALESLNKAMAELNSEKADGSSKP